MRTGLLPVGSLVVGCLLAAGPAAMSTAAGPAAMSTAAGPAAMSTAAGPAVMGAAAQTTPGCVTVRELRRARHGMGKPRVHRIFGTSGRLVYRVVDNEEKRAYPMCDDVRTLLVTYLHGELGYKRLED